MSGFTVKKQDKVKGVVQRLKKCLCIGMSILMCMTLTIGSFIPALGDEVPPGELLGGPNNPDGSYPLAADAQWTDKEWSLDQDSNGSYSGEAETLVGVFAIPDNPIITEMSPGGTGNMPGGRPKTRSIIEKAYADTMDYRYVWGKISKPTSRTYYSWNLYLNGQFEKEMQPPTKVSNPNNDSEIIVVCPGTVDFVENTGNAKMWELIDTVGYAELVWELVLYVDSDDNGIVSSEEQVGYGRTTNRFLDPENSGQYIPIDGTEKNPDGTPKYPDMVYTEDTDNDGDPDVEITISGDINKDAALVVIPIDRMTGAPLWDAFQNAATNNRVDRVYQIMLVVRDANGVITQDKGYIGPVKVHVRYSKESGFGENADSGMTDWQEYSYPAGALFMADPTAVPQQIVPMDIQLEEEHPGYATIKTYELGYFAFLGKTVNPGDGSYTVTVNVGAGGTVVGITSGSSKSYTVAHGDTLVLQANPNIGYKLGATSTGGAPLKEIGENAITIGPVTGNGTVNVTFSYVDPNDTSDPSHGINHTVSARVADACKGMGNVAVGGQNPGGQSSKQYVHGATDAIVTFHPTGGYHVASVKINGKAVFVNGSSLEFPAINEDKNVEVFFARGDALLRSSWSVAVTVSPEDAAAVTGTTTIPTGENGKFRIAAKQGQTLSAALLDGEKLAKECLIYQGDGVWLATVPYNGSNSRTLALTFKQGEWPSDDSRGPFDPDNPGGSNDPNNPNNPNNPNDPNNPGVDPSDGQFIVDLTINGNGYVYAVVQSDNGNIENIARLNASESQNDFVAMQSVSDLPNTEVDSLGMLRATARVDSSDVSYGARPSDAFSESRQLRLTPGSTVKFVLLPVYGNHISSVLKNSTDAGVGDTHVLTHTSSADRHQTLEVTYTPGIVSDPTLNDILTNGPNGANGGGTNGSNGSNGAINGSSAIKTPSNIGSALPQTGDNMGLYIVGLLGLVVIATIVVFTSRRKRDRQTSPEMIDVMQMKDENRE